MKESKIIWHPYPEEKPEKNKTYLTTIEHDAKVKIVTIKSCMNGIFSPFAPVIAWAELPTPYTGNSC